MEIDESQLATYLTGLTPAEKMRFDAIRHPSKRLEFAASRYLRTIQLGQQQIHYSEVGAPYIENEGFISLSHTHGLVGLAYSTVFNVGLDVESVREKAALLHERFMHPSEEAFFDKTSATDMSLLWSFKETLFKLAGRRGVHFSTDLIVRKETEIYSGLIDQYGAHYEYELTHRLFGHYLITCNAGKEKIKLN